MACDKHREILREAWISFYMEGVINKGSTDKRTIDSAKADFENMMQDSDGKDFVRLVYSCMDKYHKSFSKPTPRQYKNKSK